jgi:hypothetical protein
MKLSRIHIREFQSVRDSNPFGVGDITCLVGTNEAGKTALLLALYRVNPINEPDGKYDVTDDYPRADVTDYERAIDKGERKQATVVEATFTLEDVELGRLQEALGEGVVPKAEFTLMKGYQNKLTFQINANERIAGETLLQRAQLREELEANGEKWSSLAELAAILEQKAQRHQERFIEAETAANNLPDADAKTQALAAAQLLQESAASKSLRAELGEISKVGLPKYICDKYAYPYAPKFLYFDEYHLMGGCANIEGLKQRVAQDKLEAPDHPLLGLIELAGLDLDELLNPARTRELKNKLEGAGNHLSKQVMKYWSQNKHLQVRFDVRPARPQDPPDMRTGTNIWAEVYDSRHLVSTELGTRSRGFVWFFSFLAWYSKLRNAGERLVLLLDEPGLSLHAKAQEDLLRYFEAELKPHPQLVYTTHSPFMVDPRHFDRVRIVQDKIIDTEDLLPPKEEGTRVFVEVLDATGDSLLPLQGALGYEIYQNLLVGPNSLVVEGASDLLYIQAISGLLTESSREGLRPEWTITPVGGADKVPTFVALIGAQKELNVATLIDFQKVHGQMIENLYKRKLLKKSHLLTFADFTGSSEADIEDMFEPDLYVTLVNSEYARQLRRAVLLADLNLSHTRILYSLEQYFKANPLKGGITFSPYRPAKYFAEHSAAFSTLLPSTLDRFEAAFKALNGLLGNARTG